MTCVSSKDSEAFFRVPFILCRTSLQFYVAFGSFPLFFSCVSFRGRFLLEASVLSPSTENVLLSHEVCIDELCQCRLSLIIPLYSFSCEMTAKKGCFIHFLNTFYEADRKVFMVLHLSFWWESCCFSSSIMSASFLLVSSSCRYFSKPLLCSHTTALTELGEKPRWAVIPVIFYELCLAWFFLDWNYQFSRTLNEASGMSIRDGSTKDCWSWTSITSDP